jgi:DHA2 family multidrug resistance protein
MTDAPHIKAPERADMPAWFGVAAGNIGALMATLDVSIANTALPTIQGELGATSAEATWISTAYLVAEIIMIPLAGWLEKIFGLRNFLLGIVVLFTMFSMMCGVSNDFGQIIAGRIGQGFTGGAMIPMALSLVATRLPAREQPVGMAVFGLTVVLGPVLGPLIGGWLTENLNWRYVFFLNLPVGAGLVTLLLIGVKPARAQLSMFVEADWLGVAGLVLGLGSLTVVLEEGQREQWFESSLILWLTLLACLGFAMIVIAQFRPRRPVIDLRLLLIPQFAGVLAMSLVTGAGLYGTMYLVPQFLASVPGYDALQCGQVTTMNGVGTIVMVGFFPFLVRLVDLRIAIGFGLICYGLSCFWDAALSPATAGPQLFWTQGLRGFALFFSVVFLNQAATNAVPVSMAADAAGLFNTARNLGGSIGLALIAILRDRRADLHFARLAEAISDNSISGQSALGAFGAARLQAQLQAQAAVMAFADVFWLFGVAFVLMVPLVLLLRPLPKDVGFSIGG